MIITLPLEPKEEARLVAAAQAKGISMDSLIREALKTIIDDPAGPPGGSPGKVRPIWEVMLDNMSDVSAEEFGALPGDGASEHDHYLYGHPKRNQ
jgi:hypothetical protein